ncbi:TlpA disulfide reductase family protein [Pedobacter sp. PF22-3]|uniref:TlpA family protein disulfide reductase n=1 Tax=Pedobacter sp. PF22-3 TaxID=2994467 RepID=UPI0022456FE7|nr:TlpA disulfide reductase family protein [Pedobacter sp. PF22-3]MCX2495204.1 TlpA disulfide reductase family protein [Pedobacter sp. PF22-3]
MKVFIATGMMLVFSVFLYAQGPVKALQVGDRVSDAFWTSPRNFIVDGKVVRKDMQQFRGKPLIIDFWATFCIPCIKGMPEQERLSKLFRGKLNIVSVTTDNEKLVSTFYSSERNPIGRDFTSIVDDKELNSFFLHNKIPHLVWIDNQGIVKNTTDGDALSEANIKAALSGNLSLSPLNYIYPNTVLMMNRNPEGMQSFNLLIKGRIPGVSSSTFRSNGANTGMIIFNHPLRWIYTVLAMGEYPWFSDQRFKLDFDEIDGFNNPSLKPEDLWTVDLWVPKEKSALLKKLTMKYLNENSGYSAAVKVINTAVYKLKYLPSKATRQLKTKGGQPANLGFHKGSKFINQPIANLINDIQDCGFVKYPVLNGTNLDFLIDLELSAVKDMAGLNIILNPYGLFLVADHQELEMLVINKTDKTN